MLVENGKRVLVVEREIEFKDRIRGEAMGPWGVLDYKGSDFTSVLARNVLMM